MGVWLRPSQDCSTLCLVLRRLGALPCRWSVHSVLVVAVAVCALLAPASGAVADASGAHVGPRLPAVVNAPGTWSDHEGASGPVAAVGLADRTVPVGIFDERKALSYFATSALDGSSSWLDLPGFALDRWGFVGGVAVSPNGRWLGWVRTAKRRSIAGWSVLDTSTGRVRELEVEGRDRVRGTLSDLAFSGDSRYLLTSFETLAPPKHGARGHQFVAWGVTNGTAHVLEKPGHYWLPSLGYAEKGVVWSRNHEVFRADPKTGHSTSVTLPRTVLMASWAPGDAAFAYIGREDRKKGTPAPEERLYVGASASSPHRAVVLPDTSPIGEFLAWRDSTHVVLGNYRREVYVVDITDGSYETIHMAGDGAQMNTPVLATDLWAEPLNRPAEPTGTTDPRRLWRWVGLITFALLLSVGASLLRRTDKAAQRRPPWTPLTRNATRSPSGVVTDTPQAVDPVPRAAWAMAWLFLGGQCVDLMARGPNSADLQWVAVSIVLTGLVIRWVADGVLRGRTARLVIVWILLSAAMSLSLLGLVIDPSAIGVEDVLSFAVTVAQLVALGVFCTTGYFRSRRAGSDVARSALAPLLIIAIATGVLGGLTAPVAGTSAPIQLRVEL